MELALFFDDAVAMIEEGRCDKRKCFGWIHLRMKSCGRPPLLHKGVSKSSFAVIGDCAVDSYLIMLDGRFWRLPHHPRQEGQLLKVINFYEVVRRASFQEPMCSAEL